MKLFRFLLILFCAMMLSIAPSMAKPGGQGDADRAFSCIESCHVGTFSAESSATVVLELDRERVFTGQAIAVSVKVTEMQLSKKGLVGVFLGLPVSNDAGDSIEDVGWTIIQDPNGGTNNYVEKPVFSSTQGATYTWTLRAPSDVGTKQIDAAIHHGAQPNPDEFGYSTSATSPLSFEVEPMPENLPRLAEDWQPESKRLVGETSTISVDLEDTDELVIEWRIEETGAIQTATVEKKSSGTWSFELPATTDESNLSWRAKMSNPALEETTPWFTLSSTDPPYVVEETALILQALAFGILAAAIGIAMQRRFAASGKQPELAKLMTELPEMNPPPMPVDGLPQGWTSEQTQHYGHQHLAEQEGGEI